MPTIPEQNKALVLEAFDTLFNKRDYTIQSRLVRQALQIASTRTRALGGSFTRLRDLRIIT
jgi:hypothetical protein